MTAITSDYGGNNYGGRAGRTKVSKDKTRSHHCSECGKLRHTTPIEWQRAAKPRCLACGGNLIESVESTKRTLGKTSERKERDRDREFRKAETAQYIKCWSCGKKLPDPGHLSGHLRENSDCAYEYRADRKTFGDYYTDTLWVVKRDDRPTSRPWRIEGLSMSTGQVVVLAKHVHKISVEEELATILTGRPVKPVVKPAAPNPWLALQNAAQIEPKKS